MAPSEDAARLTSLKSFVHRRMVFSKAVGDAERASSQAASDEPLAGDPSDISSVPDPVANPIQDGSPPKAASVSEGQRVIYRKWNGCKIQQVIDESTGEVIIHVPGIGEMHATRDEWSLNQRRDDGPTDGPRWCGTLATSARPCVPSARA